jgi:hypothetical protein
VEQKPAPAKPPRGLINPIAVRRLAFAIISLSLVACTVMCILAIWGFTSGDVIGRAIATFLVITAATVAFTIVNRTFG